MVDRAEFVWSDQYRLHNQRGEDGPCECEDCRSELAAYRDAERAMDQGWDPSW